MVHISEIGEIFRQEYGRSVAVLVRVLGSIDAAEDAVQDAFAEAVARWPDAGLPPSPAGWIITTARNRAIDHLRREASGRDKIARSALLRSEDAALNEETVLIENTVEADAVEDNQLRLIFTCCHPALNRAAQVALTLKLLGGLTTAEIARAFLIPEPTMAQRLVRAKAKIRDARIPYRIPSGAELPARLSSVLAVAYLIFNEGYAASSGTGLVREDLCREAIRLGRLIVDLMPDEPEAKGLLALMLLLDARRRARTGPDGGLVLLADQDRSLWNSELIAEGQSLVRQCLKRNMPGPYQIQAAINAVHGDAATLEETDWRQVLALYEQLLAVEPTPVVALNRAIALAEVDGPAAGLAAVERLELGSYYLFHAVKAELLRRLGRTKEAAAAYLEARERTDNDAERSFLEARAKALTTTGSGPGGQSSADPPGP
ncbi:MULTISPECIES: RNA polymerase sigma factor [Arthrobacter]|uniref:RNA polymerase sigma factor n=1 Tax=Arthrobacter terricola TaxID=2547396 RepID=A0A4R5KNZ7_9MICC|nr:MULTISPECIES: RNA polymerase sigma factor [Arthrobacter]MBT8160825.1 RNA polymerase sigma factor [Arthrobacter sp. GN70]TDF97413.1 RNA polymerase sigma factor [Arthrobacter terricola]